MSKKKKKTLIKIRFIDYMIKLTVKDVLNLITAGS